MFQVQSKNQNHGTCLSFSILQVHLIDNLSVNSHLKNNPSEFKSILVAGQRANILQGSILRFLYGVAMATEHNMNLRNFPLPDKSLPFHLENAGPNQINFKLIESQDYRIGVILQRAFLYKKQYTMLSKLFINTR